MATKTTLIRITHDKTAVDLDLAQRPAGDVQGGIQSIINFLAGFISGVRLGKVDICPDAAQATGTGTWGGADGNLTINGVNIAVTGANDTARALDAATKVNASGDALIAGHVTATAAGAVTTLTAVTPGKPGNAITLAISGAGNSVSGARLTGGTETGQKVYRKGL